MAQVPQVKLRKQHGPISFPRTVRPDARAFNTSARAGKTYPAAFIPLMPEDGIVSSGGDASRVSFMVRMEETEKMLANAVHFRAHAYFVSLAALERFDGLDSVAYAWAGKEGAAPIVQTYVHAAADNEFYHAFGEHIKDGETINDIYVEAYNAVINYRRKQVSISLPMETLTSKNIKRALWGQTAIARIVPDFDAALIEGEFDLNIVNADVVLSGSGEISNLYLTTPASVDNSWKLNPDGTVSAQPTTSASALYVKRSGAASAAVPEANIPRVTLADIVGELTANGVRASLSNIDLAKKTQAFAVLRQQFAGNDEELIDLAMRGFRFPNQAFSDPILIGTSSGIFGMSQRYATDAASLDEYVVNGAVRVDIPLRLPQQPTGGVIVVTYEIIPEPVFDRQADMFLRATAEQLPNALRDHLDPQPVDVVPNRFVDALHTNPDGTFGYAPLNYWMARRRVGVGGRFLRGLTSDPSAEDQQHIWSVRVTDPVLNEDAFLCPEDLSHNVFRDTLLDPFLVSCSHNVSIEGITQFGPSLYESQGDYEAVASIVPTETIDPTE